MGRRSKLGRKRKYSNRKAFLDRQNKNNRKKLDDNNNCDTINNATLMVASHSLLTKLVASQQILTKVNATQTRRYKMQLQTYLLILLLLLLTTKQENWKRKKQKERRIQRNHQTLNAMKLECGSRININNLLLCLFLRTISSAHSKKNGKVRMAVLPSHASSLNLTIKKSCNDYSCLPKC